MRTKEQRAAQPNLPSVVLRLAGSLPLLPDGGTEIGNLLRVERYSLSGEDLLPEERGALVCLPIGEDTFGVQLAYTFGTAAGSSVICLHIHPQFFAQWPAALVGAEPAFRFDHTAEHELRADTVTAAIIAKLAAANAPADFSTALQLMEGVLQLLRRAAEQLSHPFAPCPVPACRFLAHDSEREKIYKARDILDAHYDERLTIKALARMVAMNECYLKKGFKTLTGATIHEYIAARRIATAKQLLQAEGRSVTEVADVLGYSSISHFSTAFKKATGLKPCELLH